MLRENYVEQQILLHRPLPVQSPQKTAHQSQQEHFFPLLHPIQSSIQLHHLPSLLQVEEQKSVLREYI